MKRNHAIAMGIVVFWMALLTALGMRAEARAAKEDLRKWDSWTKLPALKPSSGDQSIYTVCFGEDRVYTFHRGWDSAAISVVAGGCAK